jgi:dipeptidyl-peptidase 4
MNAMDVEDAIRLPGTWRNKMFRNTLEPVWLPDGRSFWYRVATGPGEEEFVLVDAETGRRSAAANLDGLGLAGSTVLHTSGLSTEPERSRNTGAPLSLEIENQLDEPVRLFWLNRQGRPKEYNRIEARGRIGMDTFEGHVWRLERIDGTTLAVVTASAAVQRIVVDGVGLPPANQSTGGPGTISPDGRWSAFTQDGKVMLRDTKTGATRHLATDLDATSPFHGPCVWSADSRAFLAQGAAPVRQRQIAIVESSPRDSVEPRLQMLDYPKPGDPLPRPVPVLFRPHEGPARLDGGRPRALPRTLRARRRVRGAALAGRPGVPPRLQPARPSALPHPRGECKDRRGACRRRRDIEDLHPLLRQKLASLAAQQRRADLDE